MIKSLSGRIVDVCPNGEKTVIWLSIDEAICCLPKDEVLKLAKKILAICETKEEK